MTWRQRRNIAAWWITGICSSVHDFFYMVTVVTVFVIFSPLWVPCWLIGRGWNKLQDWGCQARLEAHERRYPEPGIMSEVTGNKEPIVSGNDRQDP